MPVFGLYFVNYGSWQAEEHAEGCILVDLRKNCGFVVVVFWSCFKKFHLVPVPNSAQTLGMDQSLLNVSPSTALCLSNKHP